MPKRPIAASTILIPPGRCPEAATIRTIPARARDLDACGSLELNASALGIVGMPGSPFFTTVFQRMMTPAGETGGAGAPLGYAGQPGPSEESPSPASTA